MRAYVLISVSAGKTRDVVNKLRQTQGIKAVDICWGRPDIFALVEAQDQKALAHRVLDEIQTINGVESTDTHIVLE